MSLETVERIEPARIEELPERLSDRVAELAAETAILGRTLHPQTAAELARLVRLMILGALTAESCAVLSHRIT